MNKHYNKITFQGNKKNISNNYFEGWYYKQVSKDTKYTISFIPGISYNKIDPHCFIQCIICNEKEELTSYYLKYDVSKFSYQDNPFKVVIDSSSFYENSIEINIKNEDIQVEGKLEFNNLTKLNKSFFNPNIMGYFSYIPNMECNHHIISMKHEISGILNVNNKPINLNEGVGYLEKDWGSSFPKEYIWLQCNHFEKEDIKLAFSVAIIPLLGTTFKGFFCSLFIKDKEYRFAFYNNSKLKILNIDEKNFTLKLTKGSNELVIKAHVENVQELASPKDGVMNNSIKEGLSGKISISLEDSKTGYKISDNGINAGIEIMMKA